MSLVPYKITALARSDIGGLNIIPLASVAIYLRGTATFAALKTDSTGATPLANPFPCDSNGEAEPWMQGGDYTIVVAGGQSWDISVNGDTDIVKIDTWASIGTTPVSSAGKIYHLAQHTSGGLGGGPLMSFSGSVTDDGVTQKNSATPGFYLKRVNYTQITPEMAGVTNYAVNNLAALQAAANAAAANNVPLVGKYKQWLGVSGNFVVPDNSHLKNLYLKQLTPTASIRTIFKNSGTGNVIIEDCGVDRNGTADAADVQSATDSAGVWLQGFSNLTINGLEITGSGKGTGARLINLTGVLKFSGFHVHDMTYWIAVAPTTEYIGGVSLENLNQFTFENFTIMNLLSKTGSDPTRRFQTDGIGIGGQNGCTRFVVKNGFIANVGEGIDITGSGGNENFEVHSIQTEDTGFAGIKVANGNRYGSVHHNTIIRSGWTGIVVAGPGSALEKAPEDFYVHHNQIYDTGTNPEISGGSITYDGIQLAAGAISGTPRNLFVHDNIIVDRKATKTMNNGIKYYGALAPGQNVKLDNNTIEGFLTSDVTSDGLLKLGKYMYANWGTTGTFTHGVSGSWLLFNPNSLIYDGNGINSSGSYTIKITGMYLIYSNIVWIYNATGLRGVRIKRNGSVIMSDLRPAISVAGNTTPVSVQKMFVLDAGDVITFEYMQDSGLALDVSNTSTFAGLSLEKY